MEGRVGEFATKTDVCGKEGLHWGQIDISTTAKAKVDGFGKLIYLCE